jgi:hypothetical protein
VHNGSVARDSPPSDRRSVDRLPHTDGLSRSVSDGLASGSLPPLGDLSRSAPDGLAVGSLSLWGESIGTRQRRRRRLEHAEALRGRVGPEVSELDTQADWWGANHLPPTPRTHTDATPDSQTPDQVATRSRHQPLGDRPSPPATATVSRTPKSEPPTSSLRSLTPPRGESFRKRTVGPPAQPDTQEGSGPSCQVLHPITDVLKCRAPDIHRGRRP